MLAGRHLGTVAALFSSMTLPACGAPGTHSGSDDGFALFERPGRMVRLPGGNELSLYCVGQGSPTVVMETGFGGGAFYAWHRVQPLLARRTRACSYDRAGYGFSELGDDFPRDLEHFVTDLHDLLAASDERGPYVLVGHSNGGRIVETYASRYPDQVAGIVFLDAAVRLPEGAQDPRAAAAQAPDSSELPQSLRDDLRRIRGCLDRVADSSASYEPDADAACLDAELLSQLPDPMARVVAGWTSEPDYWRAYLSEAECNYGAVACTRSPPIRGDVLRDLPVRVVIASVASLDDRESAPLYGLSPDDHEAIAAARRGRTMFEDRQARVCDFATDCRVERIPTGEHYVQNAFPERVVALIGELL